jgi:hypothetical protein
MNDPLTISENVLAEASHTIRERNRQHGHTEQSFRMIAEMWSNYIAHAYTMRHEEKLRPYDVAQMMAMVKIARSVYGYSQDNYTDAAGYIALAAMLTPVQIQQEE